jgi:hypothetical protein
MTSLLCAARDRVRIVAPDRGTREGEQSEPTLLSALARLEETPVDLPRPPNHFEASNPTSIRLRRWMWTPNTTGRLRYQIVSESGSGYIRKRVFLAGSSQQKMWADATAAHPFCRNYTWTAPSADSSPRL